MRDHIAHKETSNIMSAPSVIAAAISFDDASCEKPNGCHRHAAAPVSLMKNATRKSAVELNDRTSICR